MKKIKIIIILSIIVIVWALIFFLFLRPKNNENKFLQNGNNESLQNEPLENDLKNIPPTDYDYPTEEDFILINEIYENLPKPLDDFIPEKSSYNIEYSYEVPAFIITLKVNNQKDAREAIKESLNFFDQFDLDPCEEPLSQGLAWTVDDWSVLGGEIEGEPYKEICEEIKKSK